MGFYCILMQKETCLNDIMIQLKEKGKKANMLSWQLAQNLRARGQPPFGEITTGNET